MSDVESNAPHPADAGREQRRHLRRSGAWAAEIDIGGRRARCVVLDVSEGGAKLLLEEPLAKGASATLTGERFGTRPGRVVWATDVRVGLQFVDRPPAAVPKPSDSNIKFMRGRAEVLRRLAQTAATQAASAKLLHSAALLDQEADELARLAAAAAPSIRRPSPLRA